MKVKLLSLILALTMVAALFAACGGDTTNEGSDNEGEAAPIELVWYQWGSEPNGAKEVYDVLNEMSKEALNTTVDFRFADDQKAKLIVSTNEKYDIIYSCSWQNNYAQQAAKGYYADLTDMVATVAPDLYNFIPETVWKGMEVNGKVYGVPTYKDSAKQDFWNTRQYVLDGIGMTADEFKDMFEGQFDPAVATPFLARVQEWLDTNGPTVNGITNAFMCYKIGQNWTPMVDFVTRAGAPLVVDLEKEGNPVVEVELEREDKASYYKTMYEWYKAGYINQDAPMLESEPPRLFSVGQGWRNVEPFWYDNDNKSEAVIAAKEPYAYITTDTVQGSAQAINVSSENVEAALKYLEYCNLDPEYRNIFAFGIEGKHWNKLPEGNIEITDEGRTNYAPGAFSQATFFTMHNTAPVPEGSWEDLKKTVEEAKPSPILGFVADLTPVETEISVLGNVMAKWQNTIYMPVEDPSANIDACLKELYDSGLQKVVDELQAQVDAFVAENK